MINTRCLFNKAWPLTEPPITLPVGKFSAEKVKLLGPSWAAILSKQHTKDIADKLGFSAPEEVHEDNEKEVDLTGIRGLKRTCSAGADPETPQGFKRGDKVTVMRKVTWEIPQPDNPKYRKDIAKGQQGVIEGFASQDGSLVLLKVIIDLPTGKSQAITNQIYPRNLKLTNEVLLERASTQVDTPGCPRTSPKQHAPNQCPDWVPGSSDPQSVKQQEPFPLEALDKNTKLMYLRGRIAVGLEAIYETLPCYDAEDFLLVHRKNEKGVWKDELWTLRDFEPLEIMFGPFSSQLKETHLMATANAVVTLPKHGRGAHPDNSSLALDGRGRTLMAPAGVLDEAKHEGNLYWLVQRTSEESAANLTYESATWEHQIKLNLPAHKKRKIHKVDWATSELPSFPLLVNKGPVKKSVLLQVFQLNARHSPDKNLADQTRTHSQRIGPNNEESQSSKDSSGNTEGPGTEALGENVH